MNNRLLFAITVVFLLSSSAESQQHTYCNPLNIDYGYGTKPDAIALGKHRTTADPVIAVFKGTYFLFSTNQYGYWYGDDMVHWTFVPRRFLKPYHRVFDELCAPAAGVIGDTLLLLGSTHTTTFPIWMSTNPKADEWKEAIDSLPVDAWDPAFFTDDDGALYLYWGSSNALPIWGQQLDRKTFLPIGEKKELISLHDDIHGWERFGEHADNTFLRPFIEGAWMNKHKGKYYLQYAAPGTEFSGYGDGVYTADHPLGPFSYQEHNPFALKPGGFARGAGHGATYQDLYGNWWHIGTITISVKNNFERRIGYWPAGFDSDGILYCNTSYGDYPHYLPKGAADHTQSRFTGWMLLNYNKPVTVSSTLGGYVSNFVVDENIKTYWSALSGNKGEWLESDLGEVSTVRAIQVNFADQNVELTGKQRGISHRYKIYHSRDGKKWNVTIDKSRNTADVPHDYIELDRQVEARFIKIEIHHVPTGTFALSALRIFGKGKGTVPDSVRNFVVLRGESERRNAWLKWKQSDDATGYVVYWGVDADKLYTSAMVYGANEYYCTAIDRDKSYFFRIEAFNENGVGPRSVMTKSE